MRPGTTKIIDKLQKQQSKKCVRRKVKQCRKKAALCRYVCVSLYVCLCVWTLQFAPPLPSSPLAPSLLQKRHFAATTGLVVIDTLPLPHTHTHIRTNGLPPLSNKSKTKQNIANAFAVAAKHISTSAFTLLLGGRLPLHTHAHTNIHTQRLTNKAQLILWLNGQRRFECWFEHVSFVVVVVLVVAVVVLVLLLLTILLSRLYYSSFFGVLFSYSYEFQRCSL